MKDEAKFWERVALALVIVLVMITSISAHYYSSPGNLSDIANALDDIASGLQDVASALHDIAYSL